MFTLLINIKFILILYQVAESNTAKGNVFSFGDDENEERGNWTGRLDFLLSCLGYAVGLGNVWRFPYLCYKNGGAVFFVPYVIMLAFVGMPVFMFELSIGQFTSSGALTCWKFAPLFKGVGVGMVIVSGMVGVYYNMIIGWSIWYLISSFINVKDLEWSDCDKKWNNPNCTGLMNKDAALMCNSSIKDEGFDNISRGPDGWCYVSRNLTFGNFRDTFHNVPIGIYDKDLHKALKTNHENHTKMELPTEQYLYNYMLKRNDFENGKLVTEYNMDNFGSVQWDLTLAYIAAWIIVFLSLCKGVKSSGKVVYFTALFPYVVLIILFVRGIILDGSKDGIDFYLINVDTSKLEDSVVWKDAAVQIFFSLSAAWGGLICLSSYNRFHNDCLRDTLIVSIGNCLTSFFAGFVIFSFIGFLARETEQEVEDVATSGIGLAFTVYTYAVTLMPVEGLWAVLFFLMLITLGLDSEFALVETVTTSIIDQWESSLRPKKSLVIFITCVVFFLLGLPMCCNAGGHMLQLVDTFAGGWNVMLIALCECLGIIYVYGGFRFCKDIKIMIGQSGCCGALPWECCKFWWLLNWAILTPIGVLFIMIFSWVKYERATWDSYVYPDWAQALGWLMTLAVVAGIVITPIFLAILAIREGKSLKSLITPTRDWGPALSQHRRLVDYVDDFVIDPKSDGELDLHDVKIGMQGKTNKGYE
ncbi:DgyrCDS2274 [Dimorphilus gyrociliatus]|uniref:Transporter n=1 Tax=Dimorphilus gyrociliatus TaxID=2664684 RepID=A0A7I8VBR7_9ANNE|nr:DgyrCDS2274 [Dimorphilus gyrociliatus]